MAESKNGAWAAVKSAALKVKDVCVSAGKALVHGATGIKDFISRGINFVKDKWNGDDYDPAKDRTRPPMDVEYG